MDVLSLLKGAPELIESLKSSGVPADKINPLGEALTSQLDGGDGFDLGDLLGALDLPSFLERIDVNSVADTIGLSPEIVSKAIDLIGPAVADFKPESLGGLAGLAGKLFDYARLSRAAGPSSIRTA